MSWLLLALLPSLTTWAKDAPQAEQAGQAPAAGAERKVLVEVRDRGKVLLGAQYTIPADGAFEMPLSLLVFDYRKEVFSVDVVCDDTRPCMLRVIRHFVMSQRPAFQFFEIDVKPDYTELPADLWAKQFSQKRGLSVTVSPAS